MYNAVIRVIILVNLKIYLLIIVNNFACGQCCRRIYLQRYRFVYDFSKRKTDFPQVSFRHPQTVHYYPQNKLIRL